MSDNPNLPKVPSDLDRKRQAVEQVVQQKQQLYRQRAIGSLHTLRDLAQQVDLSNPHLSRLMVNSAYGIKHGTDVLTDMTRDELWSQLGLHHGDDEEETTSEVIIIDAESQPSTSQQDLTQLLTRQAEKHEEKDNGR